MNKTRMKNKLLPILLASAAAVSASSAALIADGGFDAFDHDDLFVVEPTPLTPTVGTWLWDGNETAPVTSTGVSYGGGTDKFALGRSRDRGAIYQTTGETIGLGTTYTLTADVFNTFNQDRGNAALVGRLYYLDGITRTLIAGAEASYSGSADTEYSAPATMTFDYIGSGLAVGNALGVEFSWESSTANLPGNPSWIAVDNVDIVAVPEPSSAVLLGLGGLALVFRRRK